MTTKPEDAAPQDLTFAFAVALGGSPSALLLPRSDEWLALTPQNRTASWDVWRWFRGLEPLPHAQDDEEALIFFNDQRPNIEAIALHRVPWLRDQMSILWRLVQLAAEPREEYAANVDDARGRADLRTVLFELRI